MLWELMYHRQVFLCSIVNLSLKAKLVNSVTNGKTTLESRFLQPAPNSFQKSFPFYDLLQSNTNFTHDFSNA